MRLRRPSLVAVVIVALALPQRESAADWPQARHDPQRTAAATGTSDIEGPVAYWKRYLGGDLDAAALVVFDVDADGSSEAILIIGGSAVAKERSDVVVWQSENLELTRFIGIADLDGVNGPELLAQSKDRVYVLDLRDGRVLWAEPVGEMGTIGGTRLGDLDGDGLPELVIAECGCCRVIGPNPGFAYSFAPGVASPQRLWALPAARCNGEAALTLVSRGAGPYDVLYGEVRELVLIDGQTGAERARTAQIGNRVQESHCVPVDLEGGADDELVCVREARLNPAERSVFALRVNNTSLEVIWQRPIAPIDGGAIKWLDLVADLNGNGAPEVIVSGSTDGTSWTTYVLRGTNGAVIGTIDDEEVMGVAPAATGSVLVASSQTHLSGWVFDGTNLSLGWTVLDAVVPLTVDLVNGERTSVALRGTVALVDADDRPDLITTLRSRPGEIVGFDVSGTQASELGRFAFPPNVRAQGAWRLIGALDADLQLAVASNDGYLTLFDRELSPARPSGDDVGTARLTTGGYYAHGIRRVDNTPRTAKLGDGPDRILLVDSRGSMLALDASLGSFAAPPRVLWEVMGAQSPAVVAGLAGGNTGVACLATDQPRTTPPTYSVMVLDTAGNQVWRQPAPPAPLNDVVPGTFDGDDVPDLVYQWGDPGDVLLQTRAVSGANGATVWDATPVDPGAGRRPSGVAIGAFDGDGLDDVYHQVQRTQVLSGEDGSQLATSAAGASYYLPTLTNLDGDPALEVVLHGGPEPVSVLEDDLGSELFASPDNNRPFPYGGVADCGGGRQVLVEGSDLNSSRLKLTDLSGPAAAQERTLVLAGGRAYPDEASALPNVSFLGQLTSSTVHANLTGRGRPSAVVGSTDGFLYAIDPCAATIDFVYSFGAAVGEAVFGDTDGDGLDEILVTVQDGFLYVLRNFVMAAPASVLDTDPFSDAPGDLDELITETTLEATWTPVEGAERYEVAFVDIDGNYVGDPWMDAGNVTTFSMSHLPLLDGFYRVAVRAVRDDGRVSVDTVSNGVWVLVDDVEDGDGGCCNTGSPGGPVVLVLVVAVALGRRRRRRPAV